LPSPLQGEPSALNASVGQLVELPVQASASSHSVAAGRHTVPALPAGCAQLPAWQASTVQGLPSLVHVVPSGLKPSGGQSVAPPQISVTSHSPAPARHGVRLGAAGCVQLVPAQTSVVQTLPSLVHDWPFLVTSAGQLVAPPQVSATSHSLTAGRQTVAAATGEQVPTEPASAHESQTPAEQALLQQNPSTQ